MGAQLAQTMTGCRTPAEKRALLHLDGTIAERLHGTTARAEARALDRCS
jgi:hypothetical protein